MARSPAKTSFAAKPLANLGVTVKRISDSFILLYTRLHLPQECKSDTVFNDFRDFHLRVSFVHFEIANFFVEMKILNIVGSTQARPRLSC